jgi:hypothetical protein
MLVAVLIVGVAVALPLLGEYTVLFAQLSESGDKIVVKGVLMNCRVHCDHYA